MTPTSSKPKPSPAVKKRGKNAPAEGPGLPAAAPGRNYAVLDNLLEGCQVIDHDWHYVYVNQACVRQARHTAAELLHHTTMEVYPGIEQTDMFAVLRHCMQERAASQIENEFIYEDGTTGWFELSIQPSPEGLFILSIDITQRKRAERRLLENEATLLAFMDASRDAMVITDEQGLITHWSDSAEKITGYARGDTLGKALWQVLYRSAPPNFRMPESLESLEAMMREMLRSGESALRRQLTEATVERPDGTQVIVQDSPFVIPTLKGFRIGAILRDVTERKKAEEARRASEERFATVFQSSPNSIAITRLSDSKLVDVNRAFEKLTGWSREEALGKTPMELGTWAEPAERRELLERLVQYGTVAAYEMKMRTRSGEVRDALLSSERITLQGEACMLSVSQDITERTEAERRLRESEDRYRALYEDSPVTLWEDDFSEVKRLLDGLKQQGITDLRQYLEEHPEFVRLCIGAVRVLNVNRIGVRLFGAQDKSELLGPLGWLIGPEEEPNFKEELLCIAAGQRQFDWDGKNRAADGSLRYFHTTWSVMPGYEESLAKVLVSTEEVTERKKLEAALDAERVLLRTVIDNLPVRIYAMDAEGRKTLANREDMKSYGGRPMEEILGKTDLETFPHDIAEQYAKVDREVIESGQPLLNREEPGLDENGRRVLLLTSKVPLRDANGRITGLVGLGRDITESKRSQDERLAMAEVMSAAVLTQNLPEFFASVQRSIGRVLDARNFYVVLHNRARNLLEEVFVADKYDPQPARPADLEDSLAAFVYRTGKPLLITSAAFNQMVGAGQVKQVGADSDCWLGAPLLTAAGATGTLAVQNYTDPDCYSEADKNFLASIATQISLALERKRAEARLEEQLHRLSALRTIDQAISSNMDMHLSLDVLLSQALEELQVDAGAVLLLNDFSSDLEYVIDKGFRGKGPTGLHVKPGISYAGQVTRERRSLVIPNLHQDPANPALPDRIAAEGFATLIGVPLIAKGQMKGVLELYHRGSLTPASDWMEFLQTMARQAAIAIDGAQVFSRLQRSNLELAMAYDVTIEGWATALDLRNKAQAGHAERVTGMAVALAERFGFQADELMQVRRGALLHDIGKMGVPDAILFKPGPLTDEEWAIMKQHPTYAFEVLAPIRYLKDAAVDIPYCHHEHWDGSGYPRGLKGEEIPQAARIFSVVDAWDNLITEQPYRAAMSREAAMQQIRSKAGTQFEPRVVDAFLGYIAKS